VPAGIGRVRETSVLTQLAQRLGDGPSEREPETRQQRLRCHGLYEFDRLADLRPLLRTDLECTCAGSVCTAGCGAAASRPSRPSRPSEPLPDAVDEELHINLRNGLRVRRYLALRADHLIHRNAQRDDLQAGA
jgi:hypothetical protein